MKKTILLFLIGALLPSLAEAQSDVSLFWRSDSIQLTEIISPQADCYKLIGHHGPAVENMYMALRIYFNNSGSIDVYTKQKPGLELAAAHWYPSVQMQTEQGFGCDEYKVGKTVGLGGYKLWDGENVIDLVAGQGREIRVGKTKKGAWAEMLAKGVDFNGKGYDILIRVTVSNDSRWATAEAFSKKGGKVQFVTGVNSHPGCQRETTDGHIAVWGRHPADVSQNPILIGGGMVYPQASVCQKKISDEGIFVVSRPTRHFKTRIVSAGEKEADLNNAAKFIKYVLETK